MSTTANNEVFTMSAVTDRLGIERIIRDQHEALEGFTVVAIDGEAGTVAKAQDRVDDQHLLVHIDSGLLGLLGKDVVIEAEAIDSIDAAAHEIRVDRIADWVQTSPKVEAYLEDHAGTHSGDHAGTHSGDHAAT
ncbi:hypothetical protein BH23ACT9_BH23ACT9_05050 [soil metagenome]